jgi:hypothetical protein
MKNKNITTCLDDPVYVAKKGTRYLEPVQKYEQIVLATTVSSYTELEVSFILSSYDETYGYENEYH